MRALRSIRSVDRHRMAITSEATVISKPLSRGTPLALPPRPMITLRRARSFRSMTRRQTILLGSRFSSLPC